MSSSVGLGFVLVFALTLLVAVLISSAAKRTVLSTAVLFLVVGMVIGEGALGLVPLTAADPIVGFISQLALFAVLFSDGTRVTWRELQGAWSLPGRALILGMPLTFVVTAGLALLLTDLSVVESLLLGAILTPTDPVFAAAIVGNDAVPYRLRRMLNVESGLNDGLALPVVIVLLEIAEGRDDLHLGEIGLEILLGVAIGIAIPLIVIGLERSAWFSSSAEYAGMTLVAVGLLVFSLCQLTGANLFLAAFTAGITLASVAEREVHAYEVVGEMVAELLKLGALLVFGMLVAPYFLAEIPWTGWVFAVLALVVARPVPVWLALVGAELTGREKAAAMWFGPKGFASVVYGLMVLQSGIPAADEIFHLVALTIVMSIVAHSSTDVVVARQFDEPEEVPNWFGPEPHSTEPPSAETGVVGMLDSPDQPDAADPPRPRRDGPSAER